MTWQAGAGGDHFPDEGCRSSRGTRMLVFMGMLAEVFVLQNVSISTGFLGFLLSHGNAPVARAQKFRRVSGEYRGAGGELRHVLIAELENGIHSFGFNFSFDFTAFLDDPFQAYPADATLVELSEAAGIAFLFRQ